MLTGNSYLMVKNGVDTGAFVYVADSAMVTKEILNTMGDNYFIFLLPENHSKYSIVIEEAVSEENWEDIGILVETKKSLSRPSARYKYQEKSIGYFL